MIEAILAVIGSLQVGGFALMWYRLGKLEPPIDRGRQAVNNHEKANENNQQLLKRLKTLCPLCTLREDK